MNWIDGIKETIRDFWRYMDTTCPPGVNREKYTILKYNNREKLHKLQKTEPLLDKLLIVDLALHHYLELSVDSIFEEARWYYGEDSTNKKER